MNIRYYIDRRKRFKSLAKLVKYYSRNQDLDVLLKEPCTQDQPAAEGICIPGLKVSLTRIVNLDFSFKVIKNNFNLDLSFKVIKNNFNLDFSFKVIKIIFYLDLSFKVIKIIFYLDLSFKVVKVILNF